MKGVFLCAIIGVSFGTHVARGEDELVPFVVMNARTGAVLAQSNAHQKMSPASTTKIALLAYIASTEALDLEQKILVPREALRAVQDGEKSREGYSKYPAYILEAGGSSAGFKVGETLSLRDALFGLMLPSGNDAANVLAYYWGGRDISVCVERLNRLAEAVGCRQTHFVNPHGLHHPEQVSSAYDLALLTRYGMKFPLFQKVVKTVSYTKERTQKHPAVTWQTKNKLLIPGHACFYEHATGVKTGYHSRARHCLVASAEKGDRSLLAVLLHCPDRKYAFVQAKKLFERFFSEQKVSRLVVEPGPVQLTRPIEGQDKPLALTAAKGCSLAYYPSEEPKIHATVVWKELAFPVEQGQEVGVATIFVNDAAHEEVPLLSAAHRGATWGQRMLAVKKWSHNHVQLLCVSLAGAFVLGMCLVSRSRARR